MSDEPGRADTLRALATLADPSRRALYEMVRRSPAPVTREQAATAVGVSAKLAAFHLDKLVEVGLLVAGYDATARRRAIGRTPKAYQPSALELNFSLPERQPTALAELLIDAITSARPDESPVHAALRVADEAGQRLGAATRANRRPRRLGTERGLSLAETVLQERGFEPSRENSTYVRLRNCPYQPLAEHATELVCGMNQRFLAGFLHGLDARTLNAVLAPSPDHCCVELRGEPAS